MIKGNKFQQFLNKVIMAIDYGPKRVGFSVFTPGRDPFPLLLEQKTIKSTDELLGLVKQYIMQESVEVLVLGLPYLLDGKETDMTRHIQKIGEQIQAHIPDLPLHYQDETLSSFEAEDRMKNSPAYNFKIDKSRLDSLAASIILEDFLRDD